MHLYSVCELKSNLESVLKHYGGFFHIVCMHVNGGVLEYVCGWRRGKVVHVCGSETNYVFSILYYHIHPVNITIMYSRCTQITRGRGCKQG